MDWLTFKFCVLILVLCVSKSESQLLNSTSNVSRSDQLRTACDESQPVTPPDECNSCICYLGQIYCTNLTCPAQECVNGKELPQPDACNKCTCRRGKVTCTNMFCIPAPNCTENQLYPSQNECNACMCLNGFITCTSDVCTEENFPDVETTTTTTPPKKTENCKEGSRLPRPSDCLECVCENGRKRCKYVCSPSMQNRIAGQECRDDQPVFRPDECNECYCFEGRLECSDLVCIRGSQCTQGQDIPKPDRCNACKCIEGHILCTNYPCPTLDSRNGLIPGNSPTDLKLQVECQDGELIPHLPPPYDCYSCFCIENSIMCTTNNCVDFDPEIKGGLKEQNEKINLQNFDKQISVEPFIDILYKHNNKIPAKLIHTHAYNGFHQEIKVHANNLPKDATSLLELLATSLDKSALASIGQRLLTPQIQFDHQVEQNNLFGEGNLLTTQSSKLITSTSQSNETIFVIPIAEPFESESPQSVLNKHDTIWKTISAPAAKVYHNNPETLHDDNPLQTLSSIQQTDIIRNPSKFSRPGLPLALQTKPTRDSLELPNLNTQYKPILYPKPININNGKVNNKPLYEENNQLKPGPSGFTDKRNELSYLPSYQPNKPDINPIINYTSSNPVSETGQLIAFPNIIDDLQKPTQSQILSKPLKHYPVKPQFPFNPNPNVLPTSNNESVQHLVLFPNTANQDKPPQFGTKPGQGSPLIKIGNQTDQQQIPSNFQMTPHVIKIPDQKNRVASLEIETSKQIPLNSILGPNSALIATNIQHKPAHSQFVPNPSIYYKHEYEAPTINEVNPDEEQFIPSSKNSNTLSKQSNQKLEVTIPTVQNKTRKYNTTHSHYEKHTPITYVSAYDPNDPANLKIVAHDPNQDHIALHINEYEHNLPNHESPLQDNFQDERLRYPGAVDGPQSPTNSLENPIHQTSKEPPSSQIGLIQNQHLPGAFYDRGFTHGFQYAHIPYEDPRQMKPVDNLSPSKLVTSQNNHLLGMLDERGSADGFEYPFISAEDLTHSKIHMNKSPLPEPDISHLDPTHPNSGVNDKYHYTHNANPNHAHLKPLYKLPNFPVDPTQNQSGSDDEHGSADVSQYSLKPSDNPINSRGSLHVPQKPQLSPNHIQNLPGMIYVGVPTDGLKHPPNSAEHSSHPKEKLPDSLFVPTQIQKISGVNDYLGSAGGFRYPTNSAEKVSNPKYTLYPLSNSNENLHKYSLSAFGPNKNQQSLSFSHPSHSAQSTLYPKQYIQNQLKSPNGPTQNQHIPGIFDDRGSADSFQYPSHSTEDPLRPKKNNQNQPNSLNGPMHNQHVLGIFNDRGSADGFQYPSHSEQSLLYLKQNIQIHSAEDPLRPKNNNQNQPNSLNSPRQNQYLPGIFDGRGSADRYQYPTHSVEDSLHPKQNIQNQPNSPNGVMQNQYLPGIFEERGTADGFQYPSHSVESTLQTNNKLNTSPQSQFLPSHNQYNGTIHEQPNAPFGSTQNLPVIYDKKSQISVNDPSKLKGNIQNFPQPQVYLTQNHHKDNTLNPSDFPFGPTQINSVPAIFDTRGSADKFQYPSHSDKDLIHPINNPSTTPGSQLKPNIYNANKNNPLRPWTYLDYDQYKPSTFDDLINGVHNIPWSVPEDREKVLSSITFVPKSRLKPDQVEYKPLFNGNNEFLNQDNDELETDAELTTPRSSLIIKQDINKPSVVMSFPSISNQKDILDKDDNELQTEQGISAPTTEPTNSDSIQLNTQSKLNLVGDPDTGRPIDDGKNPHYYDQLYSLLNAVKKLSEPPFEDSTLSVDQLDLIPFLFPGVAKILNYEPEKDQEGALPDEDHELKIISLLSKLKSKFKLLPDSSIRILNWLKSKLNIYPLKYNITVNKNDIDMTKIIHLIMKLTTPKIKDNTIQEKIPFSGFDPEIIQNIMNHFQEDTLTTTPKYNYENRIKSDPSAFEKNQSKYPDIHIMLHQPNDEGDSDLPPFMETDGTVNLGTDVSYEELHDPLFSKIFSHRFRHKPKDQKQDCGDGTYWISNCHGCTCYFGESICFKMKDCVLRPFGEPMTCKPYSHFKMGCYTCECNGDGVAECDATACSSKSIEKSKERTNNQLPVFNEFFDSKKTDEILNYYNYYKKLPKDCPTQALDAQYPTCESGTSWISSCHRCQCNENGQHECVKIDNCQLDFDLYGKPSRCKPNSKFYPKSNSMPCVECLCNDEGWPHCPTMDNKSH